MLSRLLPTFRTIRPTITSSSISTPLSTLINSFSALSTHTPIQSINTPTNSRSLSTEPPSMSTSKITPKPLLPTASQQFRQMITTRDASEIGGNVMESQGKTQKYSKNGLERTWGKHVSPRKRSNKMMALVQEEEVYKSQLSKPLVFGVKYEVGDAVEIEYADSLVKGSSVNKQRGVLIGITNKGMDSSIMVRDVVLGTVIERNVKLHSPMVKSVKVVKQRFVKNGRKRIRRAKLYYLRDRPDKEVTVTG